MRFEPIAIVGQACTLPGAHDPGTLWKNVLGGVSSLAHVPAGRWGLGKDVSARFKFIMERAGDVLELDV